jgi:2-oxoglutarate ferredoxin oxidoreductase subunit delta
MSPSDDRKGMKEFSMVKRVRTKPVSEIKGKSSRGHSPKDEGIASSVSEKPKKTYDIDIFMGWCKSCGICAAFCPRECIGRDEEGSPVVRDASRCSGCGWCEVHCPDFAISVRPHNIETVKTEED